MKTFYIEAYFREDTDVKGLDDIPVLDDYAQDTKQLKITAKSKDDMTTKVLQEYKDIAYIHIIKVKQEQIQ